MNYALDAIWWRLQHPIIRDLASVLTAPPLWQSSCEFPVKNLLGDNGLRILLHWNDEPQSIPLILQQARKNTRLVGQYAENLLYAWLVHLPDFQNVQRCVPIVNEQGQRTGEWDFTFDYGGEKWHLELTCKYVGAESGRFADMLSLNPSDSLRNKYGKLEKQIAFQDDVRHGTVVRGMGFCASGQLPVLPPYSVNAWSGVFVNQLPDQEAHYYRIPRLEFLSPVRIFEHQVQTIAEVGADKGLIAVVKCRADGCYHEVQRIMLSGA